MAEIGEPEKREVWVPDDLPKEAPLIEPQRRETPAPTKVPEKEPA